MKKFLDKLQNKENLNFEESKVSFEILMEGKASDQEIFSDLHPNKCQLDAKVKSLTNYS